MDKPFSNLDEITVEELREELTNIWERLNKTVFFVTHDITEAIELSDRMLMLGDLSAMISCQRASVATY